MKTKKCSRCGMIKHLSEFSKSKKAKDGYNYWCRKCCKEYLKKYQQENKEHCKECGCKICLTTSRNGSGLCASCAKKGKRNPLFGKKLTKEHKKKIADTKRGEKCIFYKDGRTLKQYYCIDCGKEICYRTWAYGSKKCHSCSMKGKKHSKETREKISKSNTGKKLSIKQKENLSKAHKGQHSSPKTEWKKGRKPSKSEIRKKLGKRKISGLEQKLIDIINYYNLPYKFIGNGAKLFGTYCPDFIHNYKNIVIEVYNRYFKIKNYKTIINYEKERKAIFNKYNYKVIFIKDYELNNSKNIVKKLKRRWLKL